MGELPTPFTFALYGDLRNGHDIHRAICAAILKSDARFVLCSGDLVAHGSETGQWETWNRITADLRRRLPFAAAMGNHDCLGKSSSFLRQFELHRPWYDEVFGSLHVFVLDSNDWTDAQLAWLKKSAAASTSRHRVALLHHPPFTITPFRVAEAEKTREKIHALLRDLKMCAVFCGHDHNFYTTVRDGLRYVTSGGGGAPLYEQKPELSQEGDLFLKFHHFVLVQVGDTSMTARVVDPEGRGVEGLKFGLCEH